MDSCNRAHLRASFLDKLRATRLHHLITRYSDRKTAHYGPNFRAESSWVGITPNSLPTRRLPKCLPTSGFNNDYRSDHNSATFFASVPVSAPFVIDSRLHLT